MKTITFRISTSALLAALILILTGPVALAKDRDNNPPGPKGGPGSNWENPPGPAGGPGTSPDRHIAKPVVTVPVVTPAQTPVYDKADLNHDGVVDEFEKKQALKHRHAWKKHHPQRR